MLRNIISWQIFLIVLLITFSGCEGYYTLRGEVFERQNNQLKPLPKVTISVFIGKDWRKNYAYSDSAGRFTFSGLTTPQKTTYTLIFEKSGFKTDTILLIGNRGKSYFTVNHTMVPK